VGLTISQKIIKFAISGNRNRSNGTISDDKKIDDFTNGLYFLKLDNANAMLLKNKRYNVC
jgi:hypothetical protein